MGVLERELYALAVALQPAGGPLVVGGGFGLVLRLRHLEAVGARTLGDPLPARSTEDLDLFLSAELVADGAWVTALRDALAGRGYVAVPGREHYQFARAVRVGGRDRTVKVDLLAALPRTPEARARVWVDARRVRHREARGLHAHATPEALTLAESPLGVDLGGPGATVRVLVPHPFTYLVLKLHAFRDRQADADGDFGRHHAGDLYRIVTSMTEAEFDEALRIGARHADAPPVVEARRLTHTLFAGEIAPGTLALQEHARTSGFGLLGRDVLAFLEALHELLPPEEPARSA